MGYSVPAETNLCEACASGCLFCWIPVTIRYGLRGLSQFGNVLCCSGFAAAFQYSCWS